MPYHVLAYTANAFGSNNVDMTPVPDQYIAISNGHFLPHLNLNLYGGWFGGTLLTALRLVTPRSRMVVPPVLYPINTTTLPPDRPHIYDRRSNPFLLNAVEEISMQANVGGSAAALTTAIMLCGTSLDPIPAGDIYGLHGTSTTTATALGWSAITVTWDQNLPSGTYVMVGSQVESTNAIAHRWFFKDQVMQPGFLSLSAMGNMTDPSFYYGGWGKLGSFNTYTYPTLYTLCNGADTAHDVVAYLIKVG